jgi:hypothetical protein
VLTAPVRLQPCGYVVISPGDLATSEDDAGWGGRLCRQQENALRRIGGNRMGTPEPFSPQFVKVGVDRPRIAFFEVMSFDLNCEAIHIVRQQPG